MYFRAFPLAASLAVVFASTSKANLAGSTYDFYTLTYGNTQIAATNGTYTDPANPGFCVGPPLACDTGAGLSGTFVIADITPTLSTITFQFFGSTDGAGPGTFFIGLNFTGRYQVTGVTYVSGNLQQGDFFLNDYTGSGGEFRGSTTSDYAALGGASVVFNFTNEIIPEPSSISLIGTILGGLLVSLRRRRHA